MADPGEPADPKTCDRNSYVWGTLIAAVATGRVLIPRVIEFRATPQRIVAPPIYPARTMTDAVPTRTTPRSATYDQAGGEIERHDGFRYERKGPSPPNGYSHRDDPARGDRERGGVPEKGAPTSAGQRSLYQKTDRNRSAPLEEGSILAARFISNLNFPLKREGSRSRPR